MTDDNGWNPDMDVAPLNERVLAWAWRIGCAFIVERDEIGWIGLPENWPPETRELTHWMPLPAPPKQQDT